MDHNATSRRILCNLTRQWGMTPYAVSTPAEIIASLRAGKVFDAIIMDKPETDSRQFIQEIRTLSSKAELPIVLMHPKAEQLEESGAHEASLAKPIKPSQLFDALAKIFCHDIEKADAAPGSVLVPASPDAETQHAERILLAEDNLVNQRVALIMLRKLGYQADLVVNGIEVLEAIQKKSYDLILMDGQMPEMDGLEATRKLKQIFPDPKDRPWVVALTANAMQSDREACLAAGMDDFLTKPIKPQELRAALERGLARRLASISG
jgi:CheY-like chemotaxis protein